MEDEVGTFELWNYLANVGLTVLILALGLWISFKYFNKVIDKKDSLIDDERKRNLDLSEKYHKLVEGVLISEKEKSTMLDNIIDLQRSLPNVIKSEISQQNSALIVQIKDIAQQSSTNGFQQVKEFLSDDRRKRS